jgi:hypothetical protein
MHIWFLEGTDPNGNSITGHILTTEESRYWNVTDEATKWSMGTTDAEGREVSPPHHPPVRWSRAHRVEPGDELYPAHAESLIPGAVKIADWSWRIQPSGTLRVPEYRHRKEGERFGSLLNGQFLGVVVNPKLMKPALAVMQDDDYVHIMRMDVEGFPDEGQGNYERHCDDDFGAGGYAWPCQVSGCVRAHTAHGVRTKKAGYGTALYTALVLGAHLEVSPGGIADEPDCISSGEVEERGRSASAQKWWRDNSPPNRNYAEVYQHEGDFESDEYEDPEWEEWAENEVNVTRSLGRRVVGRFVELEEGDDLEDVDLTDELKEYVLESEVGDYNDMVTYVNTIRVDVAVEEDDDGEKRFKVVRAREINVDLRGTRPPENDEYRSHGATGTYNVLKYSAALRAGLIIAAADLDVLLRDVAPDALWRDVHEDRVTVHRVYVEPILALDLRGLTRDAMNLLGVLAEKGGATEEQLDHMRLRWELNLDPNEAVRQLRLLPNPGRAEATAAVAEAAEARQKLGWDRWEDDVD